MAARFASRAAAFTAYFLVFCSAVINCGIFSYFLHAYKDRNVRLVYMQVIPTITMAFYLFLQFLPFLPKYRGWMMPVNLVFSYLWLTGFVFAAEEYSTLGCSWHSPFETGRCALKHAGEAFHFIGL
ncbi:hypothetical protein TD95_004635 [Thielaviopsis punctulata]|uniref:MARVEL domain-containing protein n=1 Tax=Thielaviopsis punctulata TaxID=72032 RepID=A0A0F4ZLJ3_9PEZI|nr:hypothetical protein TD95_004635 [Thielaviopsis punctulata]